MKYSTVSLVLITLASCVTLHSAEIALPTDERAFVAMIKRAFAESEPSILVQLTFRQLPDGRSVGIESVRKTKEKLIARGMQEIAIERIDPPTRDLVDHEEKIRTCVPAEWRIRIWHTPKSSTMFFAAKVDGKVRILVQEIARD